ncbi:hypothetical protein [Massilia sp. Se16.2.3]|uniref:hypothetical protein n=1 Tax=Massilia sp. Se16.2.3 TaxID=2709303 RepID=UPI0016045E8C|nr:hypothetical protein [Massilia sp. Se16.2.3]QNB01002.1 hypothetical protein G4G31_22945 [Massilia sp. Se16.2.3]
MARRVVERAARAGLACLERVDEGIDRLQGGAGTVGQNREFLLVVALGAVGQPLQLGDALRVVGAMAGERTQLAEQTLVLGRIEFAR